MGRWHFEKLMNSLRSEIKYVGGRWVWENSESILGRLFKKIMQWYHIYKIFQEIDSALVGNSRISIISY